MFQSVTAKMFLFVPLATQYALSEAACSAQGQNCNVTKCCIDEKLICYEKNKEFADCRASCAPGIHADDGKKWATEWSCNQLSSGCSVAFQPCGGNTGKACCDGCKCTGSCQPPLNEHTCAAGSSSMAMFSTINDDGLNGPVGRMRVIGTHIVMGTAFFAVVIFGAVLLWKRHQTVNSHSDPRELDRELSDVH